MEFLYRNSIRTMMSASSSAYLALAHLLIEPVLFYMCNIRPTITLFLGPLHIYFQDGLVAFDEASVKKKMSANAFYSGYLQERFKNLRFSYAVAKPAQKTQVPVKDEEYVDNEIPAKRKGFLHNFLLTWQCFNLVNPFNSLFWYRSSNEICIVP